MTRKPNGIPQTVFAPSAVCQSDGVCAHAFQKSCVPSAEQEARRHQREHDHVEGDAVAPERQRRRNAIESVKARMATTTPAARLRQSESLAGGADRPAAWVNMPLTWSWKIDRHQSRPNGPLERERDAAVVALERQDRHQDHRARRGRSGRGRSRRRGPISPSRGALRLAPDRRGPAARVDARLRATVVSQLLAQVRRSA